MSTKIYSGFIVRKPDLAQALSHLNQVTEVAQPLCDLKHSHAVVRLAVEMLDTLSLEAAMREFAAACEPGEYSAMPAPGFVRDPAALKGVLFLAQREVMRRVGESYASNHRDPFVDSEVTVNVRIDPLTQFVMGWVSEEGLGVHKALLGVPGFEDYSYWNNVEPDEAVPEGEWQERASAWSRTLTSPQADLCIKVRASGWFDDKRIEEILSALEPARVRAEKAAREVVVNKAILELMPKREQAGLQERFSYSGVSAAMARAQKMLTDPNSELFMRHAMLSDLIFSKMAKSLTVESLQQSVLRT